MSVTHLMPVIHWLITCTLCFLTTSLISHSALEGHPENGAHFLLLRAVSQGALMAVSV